LMLEELSLLREKERKFIRMKLFLKLQIPLWVRNQDGEELLPK
jgi:hypothetical protein